MVHTIKGMIMEKKEYINNLKKFIEDSSCSYTCIETIKKILTEKHFTEFLENEEWTEQNQFFVTRASGSIIAIKMPKQKSEAFQIITTHLDTPSLLLKPNGAFCKENYLQYNVMPYGGLLNYGWLDEPLSLAGRVLIKKKNTWLEQIIDLKKTVATIPSVAIHQNDKANSNLDLNMQTDLQPMFFLSDKKESWQTFLTKELNLTKDETLGDFDLFLYNNREPVLFGKNEELLLSPRIDNITSVYAALQSFLECTPKNIAVFCAFNNEEIGSLTKEGADSNFLLDILKRIAVLKDLDITTTLASSWIISSDNTHAIHPNHPEYADITSKGHLNEGFAIIKEINSTTDAVFSSILKDLCQKNKILYQDITAKNDLVGGCTLSGLSLRHVSVNSIDVGIPELAMHSSVELCSTKDCHELYKMMKAFYNAKITNKNKSYKIS